MSNADLLREIADLRRRLERLERGGVRAPNRQPIPIAARAGAAFAVTVEKTGGSNGNATTAASWTYTVRNLAGDLTLGTVVALAHPRPKGLMTFQTGSTGYGLAFYDGATLKLWDAGEVPTKGVCA
jgi:hypothetical protein